MRGSYSFILLVLVMAVVGCAPVDTAELVAVDSSLADTSAKADNGDASVDPTKTPVDTISPTNTAEPTAAVSTPDASPEPPPTESPPLGTPEPVSDDDTAQIYAIGIYQMHSVNHSFGGDPPEFPLIYIVSTTTDGKLLYMPVTPPQEIKPDLQGAIEAQLADQMFEIVWVESRDDIPIEKSTGKIAEGLGIYMILGNIYPQADGSVQLPMHMVCGTLCLSGRTYVLEQIDDIWQVTDEVGAVIEA